eukprot:TRINITY_DN2505_c0_g6_i1.p1 TRINITY_DN2505_c0_g6~~TRINITY_DN2505_c0_g6_i1.p1  ORF type:complete len:555 (+),score=205.62 TRINITY_DN2505_c0_g6_i1:89-1753(+)
MISTTDSTGLQEQVNTMSMQQFMGPMAVNNQMNVSQPLFQDGMFPAQFAGLPLQQPNVQNNNQMPFQTGTTSPLQHLQLQPNMIQAPLQTSMPLPMPVGTAPMQTIATPTLAPSSPSVPVATTIAAPLAASTAALAAAPAVPTVPAVQGGEGEGSRPSLFIGGIPHDWTSADVADFINTKDATFHMKEGYCFVNFPDDGIAEQKAAELDGTRLIGGKTLGVRVQTRDNHQKARDHASKRKAAAAAAAAAATTPTSVTLAPQPLPNPAGDEAGNATLPTATTIQNSNGNNALLQQFGGAVAQWDSPSIAYSSMPVIQQANTQVMLQPAQRLAQTVQSQPFYNGSQGLVQTTNLMSNVPNQQQLMPSMQPFMAMTSQPMDQTTTQNMQLSQPLEELMFPGVQGMHNALAPAPVVNSGANTFVAQQGQQQMLQDDKAKKFKKVKKTCPSVFVGGLNNRVTERDLRSIFGPINEITNITIKTGFAFIDFADDDAGLIAVQRCNGCMLDGKPIAVRVQTQDNRKTAQEAKRNGNNVPAVFKKLEDSDMGMTEIATPSAP